MKTKSKLKLTDLDKIELTNRELNLIKAGEGRPKCPCVCTCNDPLRRDFGSFSTEAMVYGEYYS